MEAITHISGKIAPLPINDIDTDQIIPAQFLKVTDKEGLGKACFHNWRYLSDGSDNPEFILNQEEYGETSILIAGNNFGCGSSREHAPWALLGYGIQAVISTEFADIFYNNALKNGLLPILVDQETHRQLLSLAEEDPNTELSIDIEAQTLTLPDGRAVPFPLEGFAKYCLLNGVDQLGYLINVNDDALKYERAQDQRINTHSLGY
ncbi:3-isopropylmalate dehydratase small subunit [Anaerolineales bacterium]